MAEIEHGDIAAFAEERVNLPREKAQEHRDQVNRLRDRLAAKIDQDPKYGLVKSLHAGSVAKGMALRTVNDLDLAVYVEAENAPKDDATLVPWLADRLYDANRANMKREQFEEQPHCVTVRFRGSGLDVDVVPVLYEGGADDRGYLVNKDSGERMLTSIPLHLRFTRDRKVRYGREYAELVRLTKCWKRQVVRREGDDFKFKSFMVELLWARLADGGTDLSDYPTALESFFEYIIRSEFNEVVAFTDFVPASQLPKRGTAAIEIIDPVNPKNNVASHYSEPDRNRIITAAQDAYDAVTEARFATTKGRAVERWQIVLGPSFQG